MLKWLNVFPENWHFCLEYISLSATSLYDKRIVSVHSMKSAIQILSFIYVFMYIYIYIYIYISIKRGYERVDIEIFI